MRDMHTSDTRARKRKRHDANESRDRWDDEASLTYGDLSMRIVRSVLVSRARASLPNRFRFCEIATGPATWSFQLLEAFSDAQGVVVCVTDDFAEEVVARRSAAGYEDRLQAVTVGLPALSDLRCRTFDLSFTLDDVLDVAEEPGWILTHLIRVTKPGGLVMSLVRNLCDAVAANLADACIEQAEHALTGKGRCVPNGAEFNLFTSQSIEDLLRTAGALPCAILGVPAAAPARRFEAHGRRANSVSRMLSDGESLERVLRIERTLLEQRGGAARGSHLLSIAVVPSSGTSWGDFWLTELEGGCPRA